MRKARIARKRRAVRAVSVQKACKAGNTDCGLSEVAEVCPKLKRVFSSITPKRI